MKNNMLGTDVVTQIGLLVHDIEETSKAYAEFLGVERPPIIVTNEYEKSMTSYMGIPTKARAKLAFFKVGPNLQIELIEPDKEPSTWRNDLDTYGEGFHHIAFAVHDMQEKIEVLADDDKKLLQKAEIDGGRYAYFDARKKLKLVLELVEKDNRQQITEEEKR